MTCIHQVLPEKLIRISHSRPVFEDYIVSLKSGNYVIYCTRYFRDEYLPEKVCVSEVFSVVLECLLNPGPRRSHR